MRPRWLRLLALALLTTGLARPAAAVDDPIARWTFDASNGADISGNALDVTAHGGLVFVPGHIGQVAQLDGTTGFLDHAASPVFEPGADSWTVLAWELARADTTGGHTIVSWYRCGANPACSAPDAAVYQLMLTPQGRAQFSIRDDSAHEFVLTGNANAADGRWHLLAGTLDATADHAVLYVDGVAVKDSTTAFGSLTSGSVPVPFMIGETHRQGWGAPTAFFRGSLDDVRLYRRALSATEILTQYQAGVVAVQGPAIGDGVLLGPAHPNPSTATSSVRGSFPEAGVARLAVFDVLGRRVRRIFEGPRNAGEFAAQWDGRDETGRAAPAGVYFYRLELRSPGSPAAVRSTTITLVR